MITSGDDSLPVRPHGGTSGDDTGDGDRPAAVGAAVGVLPAASDESKSSSARVSQQAEISFNKIHRGDKIRTCDLLDPNQAL